MKGVTVILLMLCSIASTAQSFNQIGQITYVVTDIDFDESGRMWLTRQQGTLYCNYAIAATFPVQFGNECGLVGLDMYGQYAYLHISGQDSVQRVIRYDTITHSIDTIVRVSYKHPFTNNHRGGDIFVQDSIVYCSFGYGANIRDAQDLGVYKGKLLKINLNTSTTEIVLLGLRNPFRFSFNPKDGDGFVADVGSNVAEEVNYFTENYSLLNCMWPCFEGDSQLLVPDTLCDGYAYSYPEFSYSQPLPRAIIGGCFYNDLYYFCDQYKDSLNYVFGGYIDTNWVFHPLGISFPQHITGMAVNPNTGRLNLCSADGQIYELIDDPLSIDPDTTDNEPTQTIRGIHISPNGDLIQWSDLPGTIAIYSINGSQIFTSSMGGGGEYRASDLPPGVYCIVVYTPRGIEYTKKFLKIIYN